MPPSPPRHRQVAYVTASDETVYYLAHLDSFPTDVTSGAGIARGRIIGFVGNTGNAQGMPTHVHFQVHPGGGAPVNPKPILDTWLDEASAAALAPVALPVAGSAVPAVSDLRRFDTRGRPLGGSRGDGYEAAAGLVHALLEPPTPPALEAAFDAP